MAKLYSIHLFGNNVSPVTMSVRGKEDKLFQFDMPKERADAYIAAIQHLVDEDFLTYKESVVASFE